VRVAHLEIARKKFRDGIMVLSSALSTQRTCIYTRAGAGCTQLTQRDHPRAKFIRPYGKANSWPLNGPQDRADKK
jgi:hypothetical protein